MNYGKRLIVLSGDGGNITLVTESAEKASFCTLCCPVESFSGAIFLVRQGNSRITCPISKKMRLGLSLDERAHYAIVDKGAGKVLYYGTRDAKKMWLSNLTDGVIDKTEGEGESKKTAEESSAPATSKAEDKAYDDQAIAEQDYYPPEKWRIKGEVISVLQNITSGTEVTSGKASRSLRGFSSGVRASEAAMQESRTMVVGWGATADFFTVFSEQIEKAFSHCRKFKELERLIPKSRWIRIDYGRDKYYAVGLVGSKPDFICYGLPGSYCESPPKELDGYSRWLALDGRGARSRGLWLMYQDAATGASVRLPGSKAKQNSL